MFIGLMPKWNEKAQTWGWSPGFLWLNVCAPRMGRPLRGEHGVQGGDVLQGLGGQSQEDEEEDVDPGVRVGWAGVGWAGLGWGGLGCSGV